MSTTTDSDLDIRVQLIGPKEAASFLGNMPKNRNVRKTRVALFERAMREGRWREEEGEPIRFSPEGELLDGQHRLRAIIASRQTFKFVVYRNVPSSVMRVVDTGSSRNLSDYLQMEKEPYAIDLSAAIYAMMRYELHDGVVAPPTTYQRGDIDEALTFFESHQGLRGALQKGRPTAMRFRGGRGKWTALYYILSGIDQEDADFFFDKLGEGAEGLSKGHPVLALYQRLTGDLQHARGFTGIEYSALVLKAWNLYRRGTQSQVLKWQGGGARPEPYPKPE
ncbi:MAG: hypothetical protein QGI09_10555 [Dehalococcoidia bacterium]|nr:hypothetical protein [Dehalococcoidia bacterium]